MEKKKGLLDELARMTGCLYISDLHESGRSDQIKRAVQELEKDSYSDREWREAYDYVTGQKLNDETEETVRNLFEGPR